MIKSFLIGLILGFGLFFSQPTLNISVPISKSISEINLTKEKECLKEALYYEARGESLEGMKAVLTVIKNRKNAVGFPNSYCGVVHAPRQFSYRDHLRPGQRMQIKPSKALDKQAYLKVSSLADEALVGRFKPVLGPSVLYYTKLKVRKPWMKGMKVVKIVDQHKFMKEV